MPTPRLENPIEAVMEIIPGLKKTRSRLRRSVKPLASLLIFSSLLLQLGCYNRTAAVQMAQTGVDVSDSLARFYEDLAIDAREAWRFDIYDLEMKRLAILQKKLESGDNAGPNEPEGDKPDDNQEKLVMFYERAGCSELHEKIKASTEVENDSSLVMDAENNAINRCIVFALKSRSQMAHDLSALFSAMKELANYEFSAEVQSATENLSNSVAGLVPLPYAKAVIPSALLGNIAADIANIWQQKKVEKRAEEARKVIGKIQDLFQKELPFYHQISTNLVRNSESVARYAIEDGRVEAWQLLKAGPVRLGLTPIEAKWKEAIPPAEEIQDDDKPAVKLEKRRKNIKRRAQIEAFIRIVRFQSEEVGGNMAAATTSMNAALVKTGTAIENYIADSKRLDIGDVRQALGRVTFYLTEAKAAREEYRKAKGSEEKKDAGTNQ